MTNSSHAEIHIDGELNDTWSGQSFSTPSVLGLDSSSWVSGDRADEGATAVFEFRAEKSGLEEYYVYIIAAIPILLILLWIIKRRREYSY